MRKRFISGLTAVCMLGILLANSFLSVPASAVIAEVGVSVAAGLLMGTLFNQMTGGTGYDFTDAFSDCFSFVVTPHNQFIRDNPDADIYLPDGTPYYVDGQYAAAIELKKGEAEITKMVQSHWNIAESLGLKTPQETIHAAMEAFNAGLADGSIVIHVDDDGNISMPTTSYCNAVTSIYDNLGVVTSKNGLKRSTTLYSLVSPYISKVSYGWDYSYSKYEQYYAVPFVISSDGGFSLVNIRLDVQTSGFGIYSGTGWTTYIDGSYGPCVASGQYSGCFNDYDGNYHSSFSLSSDCSVLHFSASCNKGHSVSKDISIPVKYRNTFTGKTIDFTSVQKCGLAFVSNDYDIYNRFVTSYNNGDITCDRDNVTIPLTGVETTIGNMGLAGVGSGTAKGTVSVDSKTKDITVTNEATKEAELVIEQGNAGDIDTPDVDSITDKFPFSLPFDIYNLVTIFVRDEQKPIFEIPIQTTLDIAGEDYKVDEKIVLDLTQFQLNGVDIIRVFTRTVTYIAFIAFLIKITPHVIKH